MTDHLYFTSEDFTNEEYERRNILATLVIDGDCKVCKLCGAGEVELLEWSTCEAFRASRDEVKFKNCLRGD